MSRKDVRSTLDAACDAANGIENPGDRVAILVRIAMLQHRAGDAPSCARALSTALGEARQIADAGICARALARMAPARAGTGERRSWREPATAALASVARLPADGTEVCALREVAMAHAAAGEFAEAAVLTDRFADGQDRDRTLDAFAALAATAGEHPQALNLARKIGASDWRAHRLGSIAEAQGRAGDDAGAAGSIAEALQAARQVADGFDRVLGTVDICRVQVATGDLQGAKRTMGEALTLARRIADDGDRAYALSHIARNQWRLGDLVQPGLVLAEALRAARQVAPGGWRTTVLCELAEAHFRTGDRDGALRSIGEASQLLKATVRTFACVDDTRTIAVAQAIMGDSEAALETAGHIVDKPGNDHLVADLCDALCWGNRLDAAVATAVRIVSACARARTLIDIARYQTREGDPHGAARTIAIALDAAGEIPNGAECGAALVGIARMQLDIGDGGRD